ncbi:TonB-dependent receptor [Sphingomonas sp. CL5.1]|nr:TonB-dependent receptor [Sphingomonas sp. CL5.1]
MFGNRRAARGASMVALAVALAHGGAAMAQTAPEKGADSDTSDREIVVTGSRIERAGFDQPTPTTVIGASELRIAAKPNIQQVLNDSPQFRATVTPTVSSGNTATGTAPVDLRGLGTNRTLTLLDGRRFVGDGNLNFVPMSMIERVEVVTGGASAAYGSGAVAGVVNLILKKDLKGLSLGASSGVSSRGDGQRYSFDGSFGTSFADGQGHFMIGAEYVDDHGIPDRNSRPNMGSSGIVTTSAGTMLVRDVNFGNMTRGGLITTGVLAGQVFNNDGTLRPFRSGTQIGSARFNSQMVGGEDGVGLYDDVGASTPFKRFNAYARASYDVGKATLWADFSYGRTTSNGKFLPDYVVGPLTISATNPFLSPAIQAQLAAAGETSFTFNKLFDDAFELQYNVMRENKEGAIGIDGSFGNSWKYSAHYSHGEVYSDQQVRNSRIAANFARAINAVTNSAGQIVCAVNADAITTNDDPACSPLNPFGSGAASAASLAYVRGTQESFTTNKLDAAGVSLQGDLVNLWAGPLTIAFGGEARWESQKQSRGALSQISPTIFGPLTLYTSDTSGGFNVKEAFAEVALPLLNLENKAKIDLNGAARYSDYSNSGGIWSWKYGGTARLFNDLLLRVTRSRDIRSPGIGELYSVRSINIAPLVDQDKAGRTATGYNPNPQTVTTYTGGNPLLKPEIANTFTVGGSYSPSFARGLNFSVDYYNIKVDGYITTLSGTLLTLSCAQGNAASCASVIRDSTGTVTTVFTNNQNIANLETRGIDFEASYLLSLDRVNARLPGSIRMRALATYVDKFVFNNGLTSVDTAGDVGDATQRAVPKWRGTFSLSYQNSGFGFDARLRYIGGGLYNHLLPTLVNNHIDSRTYLDIGAQFKVADRFTFYANVNNVFDRDPPLITTGSPLYDIVGTYVTGGVRVNF